jgi:hypothetical protein
MSSTRNALMAFTFTGALVALAGCGSGSSGSSPNAGPAASTAPSASSSASPSATAPAAATPLQAVQSAYASTIGKKSAQLALVEHVSVAGHHITATGKGVEDFANRSFDLTTTIGGQQIEVRKVGQLLYERLPSAADSGLPGNTPWKSINLSSLLKHATGTSLSQLEAGQQDDPANTLSYLKQASANGLHRTGTASVRGVPTTKYTATIDLNKVAAAQGSKAGAVLKAEVKTLGTSKYPISVWVDHQGLVRQLSFHLTASPTLSVAGTSAHSLHISVAATMQFYDFGTTTKVTAPPASQTTDITKQVEGKAASPLGASSST